MENHHPYERRRFAPANSNLPLPQRSLPPRPQDATHVIEHLQIERKNISVSRRGNVRGEYLQITEESLDGRFRASVKIPITGAADFIRAIQKVCVPTNEHPAGQ